MSKEFKKGSPYRPNSTQDQEAESGEGSPPMQRRERVYKGTREVDHDLFKLEVAKMRKNVSYTDVPDVREIEHCHLFHTVDSNGKKQVASNQVGGHHHDIEVTADADGVPTLKVSEPRRWVLKKVRGKNQRVSVPIFLNSEKDEWDNHTHAVTYLGSEKITLRAPNVEAAKIETMARAKTAPVEGVLER